ncbi:ribonuclease H-like domain-containing protein [Tanacetum coccineum]
MMVLSQTILEMIGNTLAVSILHEEAFIDVNWVNAMNDEIHALYENKTWFMTDLLIGRKPNGCKWIFRIKYKFDDDIERSAMTPLPENIVLSHKEHDISYSVHCLSHHMHAPLKSHIDIALRVLKYLKLAPGLGDEFSKRKTEAEYRCMAFTTCEIIWIVKILGDYGMNDLVPMDLYGDNKSSIQIAANLVMHEKTKHFDIDVHLVRENVASGLIKTIKVDSKSQVTNIFTKALGTAQHPFLALIEVGSETHPPMLERGSYVPWSSRSRSYIDRNRETRKFLNHSIDKGPYQMKEIPPTDTQPAKTQTEDDLTGDDLKQYEADIEAMNLILISIPTDI